MENNNNETNSLTKCRKNETNLLNECCYKNYSINGYACDNDKKENYQENLLKCHVDGCDNYVCVWCLNNNDLYFHDEVHCGCNFKYCNGYSRWCVYNICEDCYDTHKCVDCGNLLCEYCDDECCYDCINKND